jgi:vacuolar-type H+-ATPase subunit H
MVKEVIEGIKQTEAEAAAIVEDARKKKAEIVAKARENGRKLVEDARMQGVETVKQALESAHQDAKIKIDEIASKEQAARQSLKQASSKKIPKAVALIVERTLE